MKLKLKLVSISILCFLLNNIKAQSTLPQDSIPIKWSNEFDVKYKNVRDADIGIIDADEKYYYVYSNENGVSNILKFDFEQNKVVQTKPSNLIYLGKKFEPSASNIFALKNKKVFITYYDDSKNDKRHILYSEWKSGAFSVLKSLYSFDKKSINSGVNKFLFGVSVENEQDYSGYKDQLPNFVMSADSSYLLAIDKDKIDGEIRMIAIDNNLKKTWEYLYDYKEKKEFKSIIFSAATISAKGDAYLVGRITSGIFSSSDPKFYVIKCNQSTSKEISVKINANSVANNVAISTSLKDGSILLGGLYIDKTNEHLQKGMFLAKMNPETDQISLRYKEFSKEFLDQVKLGSRSKSFLGVVDYRTRSFFEKPDGSVIFYAEYSDMNVYKTSSSPLNTTATTNSSTTTYISGPVIICATDTQGSISNLTFINKANASLNPILTSTLFINYKDNFGLFYNDDNKGIAGSQKNANSLIFSTFNGEGKLGKDYIGFNGKESDVMFIPLRSFQKQNKVILFCAWYGKLRFGTIDLNYLKEK